ncbi:MAG: hypothetical protein K9L86_00165 [Candidatus Omnitrophica bacterium]|nr:hypothetical protein [Candidatus Omnitrophota bacterium]
MRKRKKAQSILEYIIVLSAIVLAVIAASKEGGPIQGAVEQMFNDSSQLIKDKSSDFLNRAAGGQSAVE